MDNFIINFPLSKELKTILSILNQYYPDNARIVGGSVRDFLSNKEISDIDIACKFKPDKTIETLQQKNIKVIKTGIKYGTVTAIINKKTFEITTLRRDVKSFGRYADIEFIDDYYEDACRRDFTINAMSIRFDGLLFDYFSGFEDLKNKKVDFIGDTSLRIKEDYLRIMRFFRFSCSYGNTFDRCALEKIVKYKDKLKTLSSDRIRSELIKMINCTNDNQLIKTLKIMQENAIFEEIHLYNDLNLEFIENLLYFFKKTEIKRYSLIKFCSLILSRKDKKLEICKNLNFSNKDREYVSNVLKLSDSINVTSSKVDLYLKLLDFDQDIIIDSMIINFIVKFHINKIEDFNNIYNFLLKISLPKFPINGNDLLESGLRSRDIGLKLKELKRIWVRKNFCINKQELLNLL